MTWRRQLDNDPLELRGMRPDERHPVARKITALHLAKHVAGREPCAIVKGHGLDRTVDKPLIQSTVFAVGSDSLGEFATGFRKVLRLVHVSGAPPYGLSL